jgi:hypothetical protein
MTFVFALLFKFSPQPPMGLKWHPVNAVGIGVLAKFQINDQLRMSHGARSTTSTHENVYVDVRRRATRPSYSGALKPVYGRAMLKANIAGDSNATKLAEMAPGKLRSQPEPGSPGKCDIKLEFFDIRQSECNLVMSLVFCLHLKFQRQKAVSTS